MKMSSSEKRNELGFFIGYTFSENLKKNILYHQVLTLLQDYWLQLVFTKTSSFIFSRDDIRTQNCRFFFLIFFSSIFSYFEP